MIVPCKDEISFEVYMNDDAMDHVVFALAKKKAAKIMQKELGDLQRFAAILSPPVGRKWVGEELAVVSESKEVAGDMITEAVLDQVILLIFFRSHSACFGKKRWSFVVWQFLGIIFDSCTGIMIFQFAANRGFGSPTQMATFGMLFFQDLVFVSFNQSFNRGFQGSCELMRAYIF